MLDIHALLGYALHHQLIKKRDLIYHINQLRTLLKRPLEEVYYNEVKPLNLPFLVVMTPILDQAFKDGIIDSNTVHDRDRLETQIMDLLTPLPSTIQETFELKKTPLEKTSYYYHLQEATHYIKSERVQKNRLIEVSTKYGILKGTINLSKPEKDPKMISMPQAKTYPECLLCKEMEGLEDLSKPPRNNHRVIELSLNNEPFFLQYSPYVYYQEHAIIIHKAHIPMQVSENTFKRLLDFVDQFPHYFLGSNAGLPIVGGSILSHEHYQGGHASFPLDDANVLEEEMVKAITIERLAWPLSVIRLKSKDKEALIQACVTFDQVFKTYSNPELGIIPKTKEGFHNAITPIARKQNDTYQMTIALRNNITSEAFPDGVFHPHPKNQAIKKENIGLIEVLGLGILPGRLDAELKEVTRWLKNPNTATDLNESMKTWALSLSLNKITQEAIDEAAVLTFVEGLEDASLFKEDKKAFKALIDQFKEAL